MKATIAMSRKRKKAMEQNEVCQRDKMYDERERKKNDKDVKKISIFQTDGENIQVNVMQCNNG